MRIGYLVVQVHVYSGNRIGLEVIGQPYNHGNSSFPAEGYGVQLAALLKLLGDDGWEYVPTPDVLGLVNTGTVKAIMCFKQTIPGIQNPGTKGY